MQTIKLLLVLTTFLGSFALWAAEIGRVVSLRGEVLRSNAERGVASEPLKAGSHLYEGDELNSKERSFARILMKDETLFQVGPETSMQFEKFEFIAKDDRQANYKLNSGRLRSLITQQAKDGDLTITTPTASMGIRGTEILSDVYRVGDDVRTDIALLSGRLDVAANVQGGDRRVVSLQPGQVFETSRGLDAQAVSDVQVRNLPRQTMEALRLSEGRGGHTFLFDAQAAQNPRMRETARFDLRMEAPSSRGDSEEGGAEPRRVPAGSPEAAPIERQRGGEAQPSDERSQIAPQRLDGSRDAAASDSEARLQPLETRKAADDGIVKLDTRTTSFDEPVKLDTRTSSFDEPVKLDTRTSSFDEPVKLDTRTSSFDEPVKLDTRTSSFDEPVKLDTRTSSFDEPIKLDTTFSSSFDESTTIKTRDSSIYDSTITFDSKTTYYEDESLIKLDTRDKTLYDDSLTFDSSTSLYDDSLSIKTRDATFSDDSFTIDSKTSLYDDTSTLDTRIILMDDSSTKLSIYDDSLYKTTSTIDDSSTMLIDATIKETERTISSTTMETETTITQETTKTLKTTEDTTLKTIDDGGDMLRLR
jgi:hypothetical protein